MCYPLPVNKIKSEWEIIKIYICAQTNNSKIKPNSFGLVYNENTKKMLRNFHVFIFTQKKSFCYSTFSRYKYIPLSVSRNKISNCVIRHYSAYILFYSNSSKQFWSNANKCPFEWKRKSSWNKSEFFLCVKSKKV